MEMLCTLTEMMKLMFIFQYGDALYFDGEDDYNVNIFQVGDALYFDGEDDYNVVVGTTRARRINVICACVRMSVCMICLYA